MTTKLQIFINSCLHRIEKLKYKDKITNAELMERTKQVPVNQEVEEITLALDRTCDEQDLAVHSENILTLALDGTHDEQSTNSVVITS